VSYDETLAAKVRQALTATTEFEERKMFGGLCFMVDGAMCCGVIGDELIVRVGPERHDAALEQPHTRTFDFSGRPSRGMIYVGPEATRTAAALDPWLAQGLAYAAIAARAKAAKAATTAKVPKAKRP